MSVFPIWADPGSATGLAPPGEVHLEVCESVTASVGHVLVTNTGTLDAPLVEGELLEGGKQHRLVGVDAQPVLLELFADQATLAAHLTAALNGVLLDAVADRRPWLPTPGRRASRMAARISGLDLAPVAEVDARAGRSFGRADERTTVRGIEHGGALAHLTVLQLHHPLLSV